MTQSDKWKKRPAVLRYRAFCDECRLRMPGLDLIGRDIVFHLPMPPSWSKKKKGQMLGQPHQQKPDLDNLLKSLCDALNVEDAGIWHIGSLRKIWAEDGAIEVT